MEIDGDYVVAALTEVSEAGTMPLELATQNIRSILVKEKKAEIIKDKLASATSIDAAATAIGAEIKEVKDLKFNSFYIDNIGVEPKLVGAICGGAKENTLSKPVDGMSGVFVLDVNNVTVVEDVTKQSERVLLEANSLNYLTERVNMALAEGSELVDMRVKFF